MDRLSSSRAESAFVERYAITVEGIVQGVGFRPFVYHLATWLQIGGLVRNESGMVAIEAEGERGTLERFLQELRRHPPPLAQIDRIEWESQPVQGTAGFRIARSHSQSSRPISLSPDVATCRECRADVLDPQNRRFGYPLTNCTHCGPRLTIITGAPYDRPQTTMAAFPLCPACSEEYRSPGDRRFHAQPIACGACGPQLELLDGAGTPLSADDPLSAFAERLRGGEIGAVKGLGGYHLVCLADDPQAVAKLRQRKRRDEKPFAIMVADVQSAAELCQLEELERSLLDSSRAPIVLLRKRIPSAVVDAVAPKNPWLGVMLAYTPLHHLLMRALDGAPLVMTSGNRGDEPIAYHDRDAVERLRGIADSFLTHDRPIHVRCEDSLTRVVGGIELPLRRSRGYAPQPLGLAVHSPCPTLAVGGELKATFALGREAQAILSHHLGDLDHFEAYRAFEKDVALYEQIFALRPERIVHDLHPDYRSTRYACERAARDCLELVAVQHHHAHLASCMVDNGLDLSEPVIGVIFDGSGLGTDGAIWGGEFLVGDGRDFRRAAHLRYVGMPGGEQAIREPWRMAAAQLHEAVGEWGDGTPIGGANVSPLAWRTVATMLDRRLNCPQTSSMGRLFDAVAALAGVRTHASYQGQAAVELEWLASEVADDRSYPFVVEPPPSAAVSDTPLGNGAPLVIDTRPLIHAVLADVGRGVEANRVARRFHSSLSELVETVCEHLRQATGVERVVLSGGVFANALLTVETTQRLSAHGFRVYRHRQVPPGDGGLSLGQLAVAAMRGN